MTALRYFCATLVMVLAFPVPGTFADAGPKPPCDGSASYVDPGYGALGGTPNFQSWHDVNLSLAEACPQVLNGAAGLVVALATRFIHTGTVDDLARRVGEVSAMTGLKYWSVTDKKWRVLISDSFAVDDPANVHRRSDFSAKEVLSGKTLLMAQNDTRSTGTNLYALRTTAHSRDQLTVSVVNLTDIRVFFATLFGRQKLATVHFFTRVRGDVWGYYSLTVIKQGSAKSREDSIINRAAAYQRFITGENPEKEPPLAR